MVSRSPSAGRGRGGLAADQPESEGPSSSVELEYLARLISVPHTSPLLEAFIAMHLRGARAIAIVQAPAVAGENFAGDWDQDQADKGRAAGPGNKGKGRSRRASHGSAGSTGPSRRGSAGRGRRRRSSTTSLEAAVAGVRADSRTKDGGAMGHDGLGGGAGPPGDRVGLMAGSRLGRRKSSIHGHGVTEDGSQLDATAAAVEAEEASRWWTGPVVGVLRVSHLPLIVPHLPNQLFEALLRPVGDVLGLRLVSPDAMEWRDEMVKDSLRGEQDTAALLNAGAGALHAGTGYGGSDRGGPASAGSRGSAETGALSRIGSRHLAGDKDRDRPRGAVMVDGGGTGVGEGDGDGGKTLRPRPARKSREIRQVPMASPHAVGAAADLQMHAGPRTSDA